MITEIHTANYAPDLPSDLLPTTFGDLFELCTYSGEPVVTEQGTTRELLGVAFELPRPSLDQLATYFDEARSVGKGGNFRTHHQVKWEGALLKRGPYRDLVAAVPDLARAIDTDPTTKDAIHVLGADPLLTSVQLRVARDGVLVVASFRALCLTADAHRFACFLLNHVVRPVEQGTGRRVSALRCCTGSLYIFERG